MLVAFMFAGWCLLYATIERGPSRRSTVAMGVALGLGVLTKGPVAIVLPAFGALIYLLITRRSIVEQLRKAWPWTMLAIAVAIALPWYIPALLAMAVNSRRSCSRKTPVIFCPRGVGGTGEAARPIYYIGVKMIGGITPLNFLCRRRYSR